jgi:hypothetical protein
MDDQRSRLVYCRARHLFRTEMPGVGWPPGGGIGDPAIHRLRAIYLTRAEDELLVEGLIGR